MQVAVRSTWRDSRFAHGGLHTRKTVLRIALASAAAYG